MQINCSDFLYSWEIGTGCFQSQTTDLHQTELLLQKSVCMCACSLGYQGHPLMRAVSLRQRYTHLAVCVHLYLCVPVYVCDTLKHNWLPFKKTKKQKQNKKIKWGQNRKRLLTGLAQNADNGFTFPSLNIFFGLQCILCPLPYPFVCPPSESNNHI